MKDGFSLSALETFPREAYVKLARELGRAKEAQIIDRASLERTARKGEAVLGLVLALADDFDEALSEEAVDGVLAVLKHESRSLSRLMKALAEVKPDGFAPLWVGQLYALSEALKGMKPWLEEEVRRREGYNSAVFGYRRILSLFFSALADYAEKHGRDADLSFFIVTALFAEYLLLPLRDYLNGKEYYERMIENSIIMLSYLPGSEDEKREIMLSLADLTNAL